MSLGRFVVVGTVLVLGLTACAADPAGNVEPSPQASTPSLAVELIAVDVPPQAFYEGELGVSDSGCFGVQVAQGVEPAVFPMGTTVQPDGTGIRLPNGEIEIGQRFTASAGGVEFELITNADIPEACERESMTFLYPQFP